MNARGASLLTVLHLIICSGCTIYIPKSIFIFTDRTYRVILKRVFLPERNHVASLFLAVMIPGDWVHFKHLRHFNETAQVHALAKRHGQLPVDHRALAHAS